MNIFPKGINIIQNIKQAVNVMIEKLFSNILISRALVLILLFPYIGYLSNNNTILFNNYSEIENNDTIFSPINISQNHILTEPYLLSNINVWNRPIITDYDNNGFPDILYSNLWLNESEKGLYRSQMNSLKKWSINKINNMKYVEAYCNISGDENRDYLNHTEIEYNFDLALSESDKNGYITNITIFDTNYEFEDLIIDDIDADGDNDIVFGYSGGYVQVYENLGNGSFNPDWDKGIPDKIKNPKTWLP